MLYRGGEGDKGRAPNTRHERITSGSQLHDLYKCVCTHTRNRKNVLVVLIAVHKIVYSNIDLENMFFNSSQEHEISIPIFSCSAFLYKIYVPAFLKCQESETRNMRLYSISLVNTI